MKQKYPRFDMKKKPIPTRWYLMPIIWLLSMPFVLLHRVKLTKTGTEGMKPPYLLLCNHNAFFDFMVATRAVFPHRANYVVAIDGFLINEWLLRNVGCICKRKFTNDITLIRQLQRVTKNGNVAMIYPEARYSLCGTTAVLPASLGKLCKLLKVPVATLICHGHHVNAPFWNTKDRGVRKTEAEFKVLFTAEELAEMPVEEVNRQLVEAFQYDDFAWQKRRGIRIKNKNRAKGLDKVLYQCPACGAEYRMTSEGITLRCTHCGKSWTMTELGQLEAASGETEFAHIPDWYEWQRGNVRAEVESGTYSAGPMPVTVDSLPNAKGFFRLGEGVMTHDENGFHITGTDVDGDPFDIHRDVPSQYSCHIEYDYKKRGDCVSVSTLEDTWYIYPHDCDFSVTKMSLATEELYFAHWEKAGRPCREGLA